MYPVKLKNNETLPTLKTLESAIMENTNNYTKQVLQLILVNSLILKSNSDKGSPVINNINFLGYSICRNAPVI